MGGAMKKLTLLLLFAMLMAACAQVLGIRPPEKKPFSHHEHTAKAGIGCLKCHAGILRARPTRTLCISRRRQTCVSCHTKPARPSRVQRMPRARRRARRGADGPRPSEVQSRHALASAEGQLRVLPPRSRDELRPRSADEALCLSCHEHQDDFVAERACDRCHKDLRPSTCAPRATSRTTATGSGSTATGLLARDLARRATRRSSAPDAMGDRPPLPGEARVRRYDARRRAPRGLRRATRSRHGRNRALHDVPQHGRVLRELPPEKRSRRLRRGEEPAPGRVGRPSRRVERPRACGVGRPVGLRLVPHRRRGEPVYRVSSRRSDGR